MQKGTGPGTGPGGEAKCEENFGLGGAPPDPSAAGGAGGPGAASPGSHRQIYI